VLDWVIVGGESGHHARPMNPEWARSVRDQCLAAGIRFHFKQFGNWKPVSPRQVDGYEVRTLFLSNGDRITVANVGKKRAGRLLDGRTWDELPSASAVAAFAV
jgi:protein gp37